LIRTGFAVVKKGFAKQQSSSLASSQTVINAESLLTLQEQARSQGLGIFSKCNEMNNNDETSAADSFVAVFEPL